MVAALRSLLKADNTEYRYRAAELPATLGRADDQVVAVLRSLLAADITVLRYCAALLERLGRTDEQVVTALRSWLTADEPVLRYEAAYRWKSWGTPTRMSRDAPLSLDGTAAGAISACRKLGSKTWPNEQEAGSLAAVSVPERGRRTGPAVLLGGGEVQRHSPGECRQRDTVIPPGLP